MIIPTINTNEYIQIPDAPEIQFLKAMKDNSLNPRNTIVLDGFIHRFSTSDKDDESGWYVGFTDPIPAGAFGDWRTGSKFTWAGVDANMSALDKEALRARLEEAKATAEKDRAIRAKEAEEIAQRIWAEAKACKTHPYLERKNLRGSYGAKIYKNNLIVPVINNSGHIISVETITPEGKKRFLSGGSVKGGWFIVGNSERLDLPEFCAEGFATAASIYEATGKSCLVTFSAGNISAAIKSYRQVYPTYKALTIVADNDESHTGEKEAEKAKEETGCEIILIPIVGMDANDYASSGNNLKSLLIPQRPYLEPVDSYLVQKEPKKWLIKNWIPSGPALMMIFGQSGHGKTFLALDMMLSIATASRSWCRNKVNQGSVVYLCGEGQQGVRERVAAWAQSRDLKSLGNRMFISQGASLLDTADGYAKIIQSIRNLNMKIDLIMIDTLNRFMSGNENDTKDATSFIAACDKLETELGCCVCLIHHIGVNDAAKDRARGSSAFLGALDIQIHVKRSGDIHSAVMIKNKDGKEEAPINFRLKSFELSGWLDEDGETLKSAVVEMTNDKVEIEIPEQQKKDEDMLLDTVAAIGQISLDSGVTIMRERWIKFLVDRGRSKQAAQSDLNEGQERKLISRLIKYGDVLPISGGWMVVGNLESIARLNVSGRLFKEAQI